MQAYGRRHTMKLCITSTGKTLESKVDERFGRAPYFLIVDTETKEFHAVKNTALTTGRGAGVVAVQALSDLGAGALLTGIVGPNAFQALKAAGIKAYEGALETDTAASALEKFTEGRYREASGPSGGPGKGRGFKGGRR
jgi:predicted Fe-Mo cluster-binding NifX family protein